MSQVELSLVFESNGTEHDDLILRFAGKIWRCDTYYLALDGELLPDQEGIDNTRLVIRKLLEQWMSAVENVPDGGTVYLPYDFSDQYTAWLRCCRVGNMAEVCVGWAEVEGWKISPLAVGQYITLLPGFQPKGSAVQVSLEELKKTIHKIVEQNS